MTYLIRRGPKYNNRSTVFNGRAYMSKKEATFAQYLELAKKATKKGERVVKVIPQFSVDIYLDGVTLTTKPTTNKLFRIIPDFKVIYADGTEKICEVKGFSTMEWRLKWKILEAVYNREYPNLELEVIK